MFLFVTTISSGHLASEPSRIHLNLDVARLIFEYLETVSLRLLTAVNRSWKAFLKPIIAKRPTRCVLCQKMFSVTDVNQRCSYRTQPDEDYDDDDLYKSMDIFGDWDNFDGGTAGAHGYRVHSYVPPRIWSLTPQVGWYMLPFRLSRTSQGTRGLNSMSLHLISPEKHYISSYDVLEMKNLLGALQQDGGGGGRYDLLFNNEVIPKIWLKHFGDATIQKDGKTILNRLVLYYQLTTPEGPLVKIVIWTSTKSPNLMDSRKRKL